MKLLIAFAAILVGVQGRFVKLREVCRETPASNQVGICVQSEFCCKAVGGEVVTQVTGVPARRRFSSVGFSRGGISANMLLARTGASDQSEGCSYEVGWRKWRGFN